jgi:malate synthase
VSRGGIEKLFRTVDVGCDFHDHAVEMSGAITWTASIPDELKGVLTPEAVSFVAELQGRFGPTREQLLEARRQRQIRIDGGEFPDFLPETRSIREGKWTVARLPSDLLDRRVEITGPVDRKMVINALNSGAQVFMADFEDSHAPTWLGTLQGQQNLFEAVRGTLAYRSPEGKDYRLGERVATLVVRPRGWHLEERHVQLDGRPISASLFDFGLFFFHNAKAQIERGTGPYFYLPKMESHREARLWNEVFLFAQTRLGIPSGTIKATALIETILAAFEMDEILWELREHSAGLNCGRWDYIFSFIKKFREHPDFVLPDRARVTMKESFLESYCRLLVHTCHRRGVHAMGGMAAQIPIKDDPEANRQAIAKVVADKEREVGLGHDGTWVAHPGLVAEARRVFDAGMPGPNQIPADPARLPRDCGITSRDLLRVPSGAITEVGLRSNVSVGVQYLESWLRGTGCVPLYHLMEDAATAEISRAQLWQWIRHPRGVLDDGRRVTVELFRKTLTEELGHLRDRVGAAAYDSRPFVLAAQLFDRIVTEKEFTEFLTTAAYSSLIERK